MFQLDFADSADFMEYRVVKMTPEKFMQAAEKNRFNGFPLTR